MKTWLVRTARNHIEGPLETEVLKQRFVQGEFQPEDEVCPAGGYWFQLSEMAEVKRHFGLDAMIPQLSMPTDDEVTATQIARPEPEASAAVAGSTMHKKLAVSPVIPKAQNPAEELSPSVSAPEWAEKLARWPGLKWAVIGGTILLVYGLLRYSGSS